MPEKSIFPDDYGTRGHQQSTNEMLFSGYVIDRNPIDGTIKVSQGDRSNVTDWIKVTQRSTTGMQDWHLPRLNAYVHMLKVPDATYNRAIILGESYTDLYINAAEPIEIHTQGQVNLVARGYVYITCANAKVQCNQCEFTKDVLIDGNTTIKGTLTVQGTTTLESNLVVSGVSLLEGGGTATPSMINSDGSGNGS